MGSRVGLAGLGVLLASVIGAWWLLGSGPALVVPGTTPAEGEATDRLGRPAATAADHPAPPPDHPAQAAATAATPPPTDDIAGPPSAASRNTDAAADPAVAASATPDEPVPAPAPAEQVGALPPAPNSHPPANPAPADVPEAPLSLDDLASALVLPEMLECPAAARGCALAIAAVQAAGSGEIERPTITLDHADGVYLDQDELAFEVRLPPTLGGHLHLDLLTDAGEVHHLRPDARHRANRVPPGGLVRFGAATHGASGWPVGAPFGRRYLLAIVSEQPLYRGLRPEGEPLERYRDLILEALADQAHGPTAAAMVRLDVRPRDRRAAGSTGSP